MSKGMQMLVRHYFMRMLVIIAIFAVHVDMCMGVRMLVRMNHIAVAVFVRVGMRMLVGMLQFHGILNQKIRADNHHRQSKVELNGRSFP